MVKFLHYFKNLWFGGNKKVTKSNSIVITTSATAPLAVASKRKEIVMNVIQTSSKGAACLLLMFLSLKSNAQLTKTAFIKAQQQCKDMLLVTKDPAKPPRTTRPDGTLAFSPDIYDWTSGFFAGSLWYTYEATRDETLKAEALRYTEVLDSLQYFTGHHDIGFMLYCSYGNGYRLTHNEKYKDVLVQGAKSLCKRFNPATGCIKSWNQRLSWDGKTMWHYPVIIDNMMNLDLLFFASKMTGDTSFKHIAVTHALTTMKNHIRPDYSTYHVVDYDAKTGKVLHQETCQGYANNSTWARGQAWSIYGFTSVYKETGDKQFLETAQHLADFYLNNTRLPKDKIPYWDFNANQPGFQPQFNYDATKYKEIPRDVAAAAVVASALFDLSKLSDVKKGEGYKKAAIEIVKSLASPKYTAEVGTNNNFILKHATGSLPHNQEIDKPLVYADYYYLEALLKYSKL